MHTPIEQLESRRLLAASVIQPAMVVSGEPVAGTPRQVENLGRGLVAVNKGSGQVFLSWRLLANDPANTTFNLYRSVNGGSPTLRANVASTTNYTDTGVDATRSVGYFVRPVINGVEQAASNTFTLAANSPTRQFQYVDLDRPASFVDAAGATVTYSPNDTSVGDVDGDGEYEYIVKWDPSNSKDNSQSGVTGNVYIDAYKANGTKLWRIDLGRNIRAGAHYTQFIVYDLDGDGKAEVAMKTAPGTVDGLGNNVLMGTDSASADYRNSGGYILTGPEYLTIFNGETGANMATTAYVPPRGTVSSWGDSYGNRVDRFLAGVAYVDGERPSLIMSRGYYTRAVVTAWDWRGGSLSRRWTFDSNSTGNSAYRGQGTHSLSVADVDADGKDEIIFGAATIDDDGRGLYSTGLGHGDALHVGDFSPTNPGLEVFQIHEDENAHKGQGGTFRDARTGAVLWSVPGTGDVGRGVSFDIDPRYAGNESWTSSNSNVYRADGTVIEGSTHGSFNFGIWWDGDLSRELITGTTLDKWDTNTNSAGRLFTVYRAAPVESINGSKATPMLSGDLFGDWREEFILRSADNEGMYIFTTNAQTSVKMPTLMHDTQYRTAIAWQNVAYNQPPHPSFALGMGQVPKQNVRYTADAAPLQNPSVVEAGTPQRSRVTKYTLNFNEAVTINLSGVSVTRRGSGAVPFTMTALDDKTYVLNFSGIGGSLGDGVYDVDLLANAVRDSAGNVLSGGNKKLTFHRLYGDSDGNRIVNNADYGVFKATFGASSSSSNYNRNLDYDNNGIVNNADYAQFKLRFGTSVSY